MTFTQRIISLECFIQGSICHTSKISKYLTQLHYTSISMWIVINNEKCKFKNWKMIFLYRNLCHNSGTESGKPEVFPNAIYPPNHVDMPWDWAKGQKLTAAGHRRALILCTVIGSYLYYMQNVNRSGTLPNAGHSVLHSLPKSPDLLSVLENISFCISF